MLRVVILAVLLVAPAVLAGDMFEVVRSYEVFKSSQTAADAAATCANHGGQLADLSTMADLEGMRDAIGNYPVTTELWIAGTTDRSVSMVVGESDLKGTGDRCRIISNYNLGMGSEKWNLYAKYCSDKKFFICQYYSV